MPHLFRIILVVLITLILILVLTSAIARDLFNRQADRQALEVLELSAAPDQDIIQADDLQDLPVCVQKWINHSGMLGQPKTHTVRLTQTGRLRMEPDKPWMPVDAVQYINIDKPAFVWKARVQMAPFISLHGKDRYFNGHGSMQIKLLSLIPVVNTKSSPKMDQSTMVRFLAEMMWYPSAALNDYISWEEIDENSARATMSWEGVTASMVYHFSKDGDMLSNVASRYQEVNGEYVLRDWGGVSQSFRSFNGVRIANKSNVIWKYETGDFNWLQIEVTDIDFNPEGLY